MLESKYVAKGSVRNKQMTGKSRSVRTGGRTTQLWADYEFLTYMTLIALCRHVM